jgi:hypothetical protein
MEKLLIDFLGTALFFTCYEKGRCWLDEETGEMGVLDWRDAEIQLLQMRERYYHQNN